MMLKQLLLRFRPASPDPGAVDDASSLFDSAAACPLERCRLRT